MIENVAWRWFEDNVFENLIRWSCIFAKYIIVVEVCDLFIPWHDDHYDESCESYFMNSEY